MRYAPRTVPGEFGGLLRRVATLEREKGAAAGGGAGAVTQLYDTTVASPVASIDITSISGAYTHLWLFAYLRGSVAGGNTEARIRFNNDVNPAYYWERQYGSAATNSSAESLSDTSGFIGWMPGTSFANAWSGIVLHIPAYSTAVGFKPCLCQCALLQAATTTNTIVAHSAVHWVGANSLFAINRITIFPVSNNIVGGSRVTLYGVT